MASLSFSTWQIHELCILDWLFAIEYIWNFGIYKKNKTFLRVSNTLILFLISGICILNWHYYNNNYQLRWLIDFQAFLTLVGNLLCPIILATRSTSQDE
uniref:Uncharacterized protein n=1 Tax=Eustigmatophyceae sp. Ndem 8/9T-3m6.8 TaxID=2506146 RepID=A0A410D2H4_9STRA|nr:hypothetical protein Ycf49 [Eustigmatophyceae sp. Ndem 8/9T-3m6.8]QAA11916.1 hypothetical protein Ycf49 [Eustigmatophyceae sp. Ndem 8/9T-3m6.8]